MSEASRRFVHEPLIAGALAVPGADLDDVMTPPHWSPATKVRTIRRDGLVLMASQRLHRLPAGSGWYWAPLDQSVDVASIPDARDRALAAGCVRTTDGWQLFTDALGAQMLYFTVLSGVVWFSNSARTLMEVVKASTGTDLAAAGPDVAGWHSILLLGFPAPGRSAYRSIRTFLPGGAVTTSAGRDVQLSTAEYPVSSPERRSLGDLADAVAASLPKRRQRIELPLSGGWDSRLLAGLIVKGPRRSVRSWTSEIDDGIDLDLDYAPRVADALGIRHVRFEGDETRWSDRALDVARRSDHQTWHHTWLIPFVRHLQGVARGPVVDGFAGDFFLRAVFQSPERDDLVGIDARRSLWREMGGNRAEVEDVWSGDARRAFAGTAFDSFDEATSQFEGHPDWQVLTVLTTRAVRCIGVSPLRLFAPELDVRMPFLADAVRSTILAPGINEQRGPELYRTLLDLAAPAVARLPSTNDPDVVKQPIGPRRQTSPEALQTMAAGISTHDDALRLLSPRLRQWVVDGDLDALLSSTRYVLPLRTLQAVHAYSMWCEEYPQSRSGIWD